MQGKQNKLLKSPRLLSAQFAYLDRVCRATQAVFSLCGERSTCLVGGRGPPTPF